MKGGVEMQFVDFEYDGTSLSSKGMIVVSFDGMQDDDITTDSQRSFESISLFNGKYQPFVYSIYEDRLEIDFSIGRNICSNDVEDYFLTVAQLESLQYWLNRPTAHKFKILQDAEYVNIFWEGSFNMDWVKLGEKVIGVNLHFISNRPFALGEKEVFAEENLNQDNVIYIIDSSSDEGSIVPSVEITLKEDGDLELTNTFNEEEIRTIITGCKADEVITFSSALQIKSSDSSHKVMDCFNWVFPRIYNVYGNNINRFSSNLDCECTISYNPIRKVTFS
jgi:hypothetical protein